MIQTRPKLHPNGFTLVEMGIVLAITTTLVSVVIPSVIQSYRTNLSMKVVDDFKKIADVSRAYALDNPTGSDFGRWPGLDYNGGAINWNETGCTFQNTEGPFGSLVREGYLNAPMVDPWGAEYQFGLGPSCQVLYVRTAPDSVPTDLYATIVAQLPETECVGNTCTMTMRLPTLAASIRPTEDSCGIHQTETVTYFRINNTRDRCVARRTWCNEQRGATPTSVPLQFTLGNCNTPENQCNRCVGSLCVQYLCAVGVPNFASAAYMAKPANGLPCPGFSITEEQAVAACEP